MIVMDGGKMYFQKSGNDVEARADAPALSYPLVSPIANPAAHPRTAFARAAFFNSAAWRDSGVGSIHIASRCGTS